MAELIVEEPIRLVAETKGLAIGPRGKSAYQLAVENGFPGTVEQWLETLKGEPGEAGQGEPQKQSDYGQRADAQVDFIMNRPRYPKRWKGYVDFGNEEIPIPIPENLQVNIMQDLMPDTARTFSVCVAAVVDGKIGYASDAVVFTENYDGDRIYTLFNYTWNPVENAEYYVLYFNRQNPVQFIIGEPAFVTAVQGNSIEGVTISNLEQGDFPNAVQVPEEFGCIPTNPNLSSPSNIEVSIGEGNLTPFNIQIEIRALNQYGQVSKPTEKFSIACQSGESGVIPAMVRWDAVGNAAYYLVSYYSPPGNYQTTGITAELEEDMWQFD